MDRDILSKRLKILKELKELEETYANTRELSPTEADDEYYRLTEQLEKLDEELINSDSYLRRTPGEIYSEFIGRNFIPGDWNYFVFYDHRDKEFKLDSEKNDDLSLAGLKYFSITEAMELRDKLNENLRYKLFRGE